ncbi:hypothetical protein D9758_010431 [Tetrapyrgos nigripes]|uniref:Uncharacterized protein n=1 Tax=Tetrapyrgos nigripes TaxID=182062 RepID=A0A8H5CQ37_9AGAR|nr:hypothetical protein D9758_010431 [Tetrapyrgos nigripes]
MRLLTLPFFVQTRLTTDAQPTRVPYVPDKLFQIGPFAYTHRLREVNGFLHFVSRSFGSGFHQEFSPSLSDNAHRVYGRIFTSGLQDPTEGNPP